MAIGQLEDARQVAEQTGMLVGLYYDLAVGVDSSGADVWSDRSLYCLDASVGVWGCTTGTEPGTATL